ncbi:MAG: hemolysin III family protein [Bacteroidota bacterium]
MENFPTHHFPDFSRKEEMVHYITHGVSAVVSLVGMIWLVEKGIQSGSNTVLGSLIVFGTVLTFCFLASAVYHFVEKSRLKARLRLMDHLAIYLLIAGTYTPFTLVNLRESWGLFIFCLIWLLALTGIFFKISIRKQLQQYEKVDAFFYAAMGCLAIVFIQPILEHIHAQGIMLLAAGGAMYLSGIFFYLKKTIPYHHAIWHIFVMAGAAMHFSAVLYYVVP